jgi:hypothetical protein
MLPKLSPRDLNRRRRVSENENCMRNEPHFTATRMPQSRTCQGGTAGRPPPHTTRRDERGGDQSEMRFAAAGLNQDGDARPAGRKRDPWRQFRGDRWTRTRRTEGRWKGRAAHMASPAALGALAPTPRLRPGGHSGQTTACFEAPEAIQW